MPPRKEDFILGEAVGEGSFGHVYRARRRETDEYVAMKVMSKQQIVRENKVKYVRNERDVLGRIEHVGVVKMLFTFQDSASLFVGMELAEGGELFQQLRERKRFPLELARFYAAQVTDVLEYLHTKVGCVHRDLKPENILLTKDGHVKLADFGSSKLLVTARAAEYEDVTTAEDAPGPVPTRAEDVNDTNGKGETTGSRRGSERRTMSFVGTAEYVSPEVLQGSKGEITTAADIWALGCVIFQMLVGRPPFRGESEYLTFQKVISRDFGDVPDNLVPDAASTLIDALLQIEPSERLGAGEGGFRALKDHPFFDGIDWTNLWTCAPPMPPVERSASAGCEKSVSEMTAELEDIIEKSKAVEMPSAGDAAIGGSSELKGREKWMQFCEEGEMILRYGLTKKHRGLIPKKRELILTDAPRLLYVDPSTMAVKGEIPITDADMSIEVVKEFLSVKVPGREYKIEDVGKDAAGWAAAIRNAVESSLSPPKPPE